MEIDPNKAVEYIIKHAEEYAKAKANRIYLEEWRKSKKAMLMKSSGVDAIGAQEREAYADPEYKEVLEGLKVAVEIEEGLRWKIEAARMRVDVWRTQQANNRAIDKAAA